MRTVCTIYWDEENHLHHTIVSEVEENGSHKVVRSTISDNTVSFGHFTAKDWIIQYATRVFGADSVRFYMVKEVKE